MDATLKQEIVDLIKSMQQVDSIEIGNSKTGVIKIYCDFNNPLAAERKISDAIDVLLKKRTEVLGE